MVNRTQALVLAFFILVWMGLVVILVVAPDVYGPTLRLPAGQRAPAELAFLAAITALIALATIGVVRRWRWMFWLILVAFAFGILRVPASVLQLTGALSAGGPTWYVLLQGVIGIVQFAVALVMLAGYRRGGVWGRSREPRARA